MIRATLSPLVFHPSPYPEKDRTMTTPTYRLADVDGKLCVVCSTPAWNTPEIIHNYWPTSASTFRLLQDRFPDSEALDRANWPRLLAEFQVKQSRPGEYFIESPFRAYGCDFYLELQDGGRTESIRTESTPAPRPRTRLALEWTDGKWFKNTAAGWKLA